VHKSREPNGASHQPLVLVVDDDIDIREALAEVLEDAGYRVAAAANGAEAWEYLHSRPLPSLILLDLLMPVMTGPEFLTQLLASERLARIPTIVMTASPQWNLHADLPMLTKPMRTDQLLATIGKIAAPAGPGDGV
jgi:CheY-like chemotaxis protein